MIKRCHTIQVLRQVRIRLGDLAGCFGQDRSWKRVHPWFLTVILSLFMVQEGYSQNPINRQRRIWEKRKPFSYSYDYQVRCFCPEAMQGPFRVVVQADTVVTVNDRPYDRNEFRLILTPDQLFARAQRYLDRKPDKKRLDFNPVYGFIESAAFDPRTRLMDDEFQWTIREFTVIATGVDDKGPK